MSQVAVETIESVAKPFELQADAYVDLQARTDTGGRLRSPPLKLSGALDDYVRSKNSQEDNDLTVNIGREYSGVSLKEIMELPEDQRSKVLRDLAIVISNRGMVVFRKQDDFEPTKLAELALELGTLTGKPETSTLHIHPVQELKEDGSLPLGQIDNMPGKDGRHINGKRELRSVIASSNWHTDVSFEPKPAGYTMLRIHTLPKTGADTLYSSAYGLYDKLSPGYRRFLEGLTALHDAYQFREQAARNGFKLRTEPRGSPDNAGDAFNAVHPVIRTNPVTGRKGVFVNRTFTTRILELTPDESRSVLDYLFLLQAQSHDLQVRHRWTRNDVVIWDNRSTQHAATFDIGEDAIRKGDRAVCCGEAPYLDI